MLGDVRCCGHCVSREGRAGKALAKDHLTCGAEALVAGDHRCGTTFMMSAKCGLLGLDGVEIDLNLSICKVSAKVTFRTLGRSRNAMWSMTL